MGIQDLKVTIHESTLVFPSQETERRRMFLSNIDQFLNFNVETVHFFNANPDFPPEIARDRLKTAISRVPVPYYFLAGRLKVNQISGRLEIDCNREGAVFVVASSEYSLDEIGDLVYPNPAFRQLIDLSVNNLEGTEPPLLIVQVTLLKCGGFVIGISVNHTPLDGIGFKQFLENLASQAFDDKPLAVIPCNDRQLLAARSPPSVEFPHPYLLKLELPIEEESTASIFDCSQEELDSQIFRLSFNDITYLKDKAKSGETKATTKITSFNVVTAHLWRCKALSSDMETKDRLFSVIFAVDIRPRMRPPLPASYPGNAVLTAYATAKCSELGEWPFSKLVDMVSEAATRMTDENARSAIDWSELYKGFPHGDFLISSWWKLGFAEVEYPWGRPKYSCPVVYKRNNNILLLPEIGANSDSGVNILVPLAAKEMEKFRSLFYKLLA